MWELPDDEPSPSVFGEDSAQFHAQILDAVEQAVIVTDPQGVIISWNRYAETLYGWTKEEAVGNSLGMIVHQQDLTKAAEVLQRLQSGRSWSGEFRVRRQDGTTFLAEIRNAPLLRYGIVQAIVGVSQDITQRRQAETELRQSEARFRELIEQAPYVIQVFDPSGRTIRVNRAWRKLWGMTVDQIGDYNILEDPQLREHGVLPLIRRGFAGETVRIPAISYDLKQPHQQPSTPLGVRRWGSAVIYPVKDAQGKLQEVVILYRDITARKQAEDALKKSEQLYRAVGESIDYGVWVCDREGRPKYASDSLLRLIGLAEEECSCVGWLGALHPDDQERAKDAWKKWIAEESKLDVELRLRGHDGVWHPVLVRGVPVRSDEGQITAWAGICLDIHRLKEAEEELRIADRRKDQFLTTLAHEMRNPLAPIRNALQLLRNPGVDPVTSERLHDVIERQTSQLMLLVEDLLDVSRVVKEKIELHQERLEISELFASAVETTQPLIDSQGHRLVIDVPPQPLHLYADRMRLTQVLSNVLTNAAKYTDPHGHLWLSARQVEGCVEISIRDDGIGIRPDVLPGVFDLFVQASEAIGHSRGGLGVGLSLAKKLVELHGGTISVRSEGVGKGTEVRISLPAHINR